MMIMIMKLSDDGFLLCNRDVRFCYHVTHVSDNTVTIDHSISNTPKKHNYRSHNCILNELNNISLQKLLHEGKILEYPATVCQNR